MRGAVTTATAIEPVGAAAASPVTNCDGGDGASRACAVAAAPWVSLFFLCFSLQQPQYE